MSSVAKWIEENKSSLPKPNQVIQGEIRLGDGVTASVCVWEGVVTIDLWRQTKKRSQLLSSAKVLSVEEVESWLTLLRAGLKRRGLLK